MPIRDTSNRRRAGAAIGPPGQLGPWEARVAPIRNHHNGEGRMGALTLLRNMLIHSRNASHRGACQHAPQANRRKANTSGIGGTHQSGLGLRFTGL